MNVHQVAFHIFSQLGNIVYSINKKLFKQSFTDIPFVSEVFPKNLVMKRFSFQRLAVIHIALGEQKIKCFTAFIDNQVKFKAKEPANRTLPFGGHSLE